MTPHLPIKPKKLTPAEAAYLQAVRDGRDTRVSTKAGLREPKTGKLLRMGSYITSVRMRDETGAIVGIRWALSEKGEAALAESATT